MLVFYKLLGKDFLAVLTLVKLDALVFVFPASAFNDFSTLTIRATGCLRVRWLVLVLPEKVKVAIGFEFFGFRFVWHGVDGYITKWARVISRVWAAKGTPWSIPVTGRGVSPAIVCIAHAFAARAPQG